MHQCQKKMVQDFFLPFLHMAKGVLFSISLSCNVKPPWLPIFVFGFISNYYSPTSLLIYYCFAHWFKTACDLLWGSLMSSPKPLLALMVIVEGALEKDCTVQGFCYINSYFIQWVPILFARAMKLTSMELATMRVKCKSYLENICLVALEINSPELIFKKLW